MAVTRLKRKDRQNKVVAKLHQQHKYLRIKTVSIKSPYKDQTGIVDE